MFDVANRLEGRALNDELQLLADTLRQAIWLYDYMGARWLARKIAFRDDFLQIPEDPEDDVTGEDVSGRSIEWCKAAIKCNALVDYLVGELPDDRTQVEAVLDRLAGHKLNWRLRSQEAVLRLAFEGGDVELAARLASETHQRQDFVALPAEGSGAQRTRDPHWRQLAFPELARGGIENEPSVRHADAEAISALQADSWSGMEDAEFCVHTQEYARAVEALVGQWKARATSTVVATFLRRHARFRPVVWGELERRIEERNDDAQPRDQHANGDRRTRWTT